MVSPANKDGRKRRKVRMKMPITVREFSEVAKIKPFKIIADLMEIGILSTLNQQLTEESIALIGKKNGLDVEIAPPTQF
jgi:hypothetical protein